MRKIELHNPYSGKEGNPLCWTTVVQTAFHALATASKPTPKQATAPFLLGAFVKDILQRQKLYDINRKTSSQFNWVTIYHKECGLHATDPENRIAHE